ILVLEGAVCNPIVGSTQLVHEVQAQPSLLVLVPGKRRPNVEVNPRLGNQPILGHRSFFFERRSNTSWAGFARLGSRRYSASRSSASARCASGTGISPGLSAIRSQSACR